MSIAGLAAAAAGTAYLDAKYNISGDAKMILNAIWVERKVNKARAYRLVKCIHRNIPYRSY